jgi:dihydropteroate synthase
MATAPTLLPPGRTAVMGILNLTPDSFSDGGAHATLEQALAGARKMIAAGADILDLGGESTRPGAAPVGEQEELDRVLPALQAIRAESDIALSIDTMKPAVARAAVAAGAVIWNDVSALGGEGALQTAASLGVPVILMHMQGDPRTMQAGPAYTDVVAEVRGVLLARAKAAMDAGAPRGNIWLDPGIGFGKALAHNLALLAALPDFAALGHPLVVGASRKRFIAHLMKAARGGGGEDAQDRLGGSLAVALHAARTGAAVVRVHDVAETVQALAVQRAVAEAGR